MFTCIDVKFIFDSVRLGLSSPANISLVGRKDGTNENFRRAFFPARLTTPGSPRMKSP